MPITASSRAVAAAALVTVALTLTTACHDAPGNTSDNPVSAVSPAPGTATDDGNPRALAAGSPAPPRCSDSTPAHCRDGTAACC